MTAARKKCSVPVTSIPVATERRTHGVKVFAFDTTEVRLDDREELDEIVAYGFLHLERMDTGAWWMGITTTDGKRLMVNLWSPRGATVHGRAEYDGDDVMVAALHPAVKRIERATKRRYQRRRPRTRL